MQAFWLSLGVVFLAEMGDKTQLVALCLASRFNARVVLAGVFVATLAVHMVSVLLGGGLARFVPAGWIALASGVAFIGFGLWTLRGDSLSEEECRNIQGRSPFWLVVTTFFLAELGDKTMLSTVTLAASNSIIMVWLGSTLGMVVADGLAIVVGQVLGAKLPERAIKVGAAIVFFGFGVFSGIRGAEELPPAGWIAGLGAVTLFTVLFVRGTRAGTSQPVPLLEQAEKERSSAGG